MSAGTAMLQRQRPPEWYAEQQRAFLDAIAPINAQKAYLYSLFMPTVIINATTGELISAAYPEEVQAMVAELDRAIQRVAENWGDGLFAVQKHSTTGSENSA